jgi:hypothetical protein
MRGEVRKTAIRNLVGVVEVNGHQGLGTEGVGIRTVPGPPATPQPSCCSTVRLARFRSRRATDAAVRDARFETGWSVGFPCRVPGRFKLSVRLQGGPRRAAHTAVWARGRPAAVALVRPRKTPADWREMRDAPGPPSDRTRA